MTTAILSLRKPVRREFMAGDKQRRVVHPFSFKNSPLVPINTLRKREMYGVSRACRFP